jgi:hypothetical protein
MSASDEVTLTSGDLNVASPSRNASIEPEAVRQRDTPGSKPNAQIKLRFPLHSPGPRFAYLLQRHISLPMPAASQGEHGVHHVDETGSTLVTTQDVKRECSDAPR